MNRVAMRMLSGDRSKYLAILFGLTCAALLVTQEAAIFLGYMTRTYAFIDDTPADVWLMNPEMEHTDDAKRMPDTALLRARGVAGVEWAEPLYKGLLNVRMSGGHEQACSIIGVDDATLTGGPPQMVQGNVESLREDGAVVIDKTEAATRFARTAADGRTKIPLQIGDTLEINDHRTRVVGFCRITKPFFWQPVIYSTYTQALTISPQQRRMLTYVLIKAQPGVNLAALCERLRAATGQAAYSAHDFRRLTATYVVRQTGIAVNFGIVVLLGLVIGMAIAGQTFYGFTLENLKYFGMLKAMGASDRRLLGMILLQAGVAGAIGYGVGVGGAAIFGKLVDGTGLSFYLPWQLLVFSGGCVILACLVPALLSARTVRKLEPGVVFKG